MADDITKTRDIVSRSHCIFGACRAVNLCKGTHCVGADLEQAGYILKADGTMREGKKPSA